MPLRHNIGKYLNRAKFVFEIRIQAKSMKIIATPNYASRANVRE
jgi:hypothetical protein